MNRITKIAVAGTAAAASRAGCTTTTATSDTKTGSNTYVYSNHFSSTVKSKVDSCEG